MNKATIPIATHSGDLKIGDGVIECAVLEDGRRVLTQQGFLLAIGRARTARGGQGSSLGVIPVLAAKNLQAFIDDELEQQMQPVEFRTPRGAIAYAFPAEALPKVCNVYLLARDKGALDERQKPIAAQCDILMRGLATVGIVALVDEATGYQQDRARDALAEYLRKFISDELCRWVKTFPNEFYKELFRVYGLPYSGFNSRRPSFVGRVTNNLVYKRLGPEVLKELEARNPKMPTGRRRHKHFQWLTEDIGHPRLREHIFALITLLRVCPSGNRAQFKQLVDRALPLWENTQQKALPGMD
jgi:hypothetical protein